MYYVHVYIIPKNKYHINFVRVTIYNFKKSMIQILQDIELC